MWRSQEEKEEWADNHGYSRVRCPICHRTSYSDTGVPECCPQEEKMRNREKIENTDYEVVKVDNGEATLRDADGKLEIWFQNDSASYTLEIDGVGYEFARSL